MTDIANGSSSRNPGGLAELGGAAGEACLPGLSCMTRAGGADE